MRQSEDKKTPDLLGDTCDMAGPVPAKPTPAERAAIRAERYRQAHGVKALTININAEVLAAFHVWAETKGKGRTKSQIIQRLIETQLLRKR